MQETSAGKTKNREAPRNRIEAAVTCRPYVSDSDIRTANGVMRNFSCEGSYIETTCTFKPGTILVVRMIQYPPMPTIKNDEDRPRSICLAEVKWQKELANAPPVHYGMGLRLLR